MTAEKRSLPYGLWPSLVSPQSLAEGLRLADVAWDSDGARLVWLEGRSDRGVLVCQAASGEAPREITTDLSVRARIGYGGGDFSVAGGYAYFCAADGRLYRQPLDGGAPTALTPGFGEVAAPTVSPDHQWVVFVHTYEDRDCLAIVDSRAQYWPQKLLAGNDFYMQPCWHPDGTQLAWVAWDHPRMPWEGAYLHMATVHTSRAGLPHLTDMRTVAGSDRVGIFQPSFSPDGRCLAYMADTSGWYNLYLYDLATGTHRTLTQHSADLAQPAWLQGMRTYGFSSDGRSLVYLCNERGFRRLWRYDLHTHHSCEHMGLESYTYLEQPALSPTRPLLACLASSSTIPPRIVTLELETSAPSRICRRSAAEHVPASYLSSPQALAWDSPDGTAVHGLFYRPQHPEYQGLGQPPAIIHVHGGPTSQAVASFHPQTQFFTSRGYAVLQVNYRGSTGYGRAYMEALRGQWGIADVEDAVSGARHLVEQGLVDTQRLVIIGGSAGGYTVLQTLVRYPGFFKAALCLYGIANLFTLAATTHKFEAHYLDSLIGPLPEAAALYRDRSPLFAAQAIRDPIAVFQGAMDQVVPPAQSEAIVASLARRGVPHEYHVYAGEGHGWRKAATIAAFYAAVEAFLRQYVLFA